MLAPLLQGGEFDPEIKLTLSYSMIAGLIVIGTRKIPLQVMHKTPGSGD
jgi:hypothetical protein